MSIDCSHGSCFNRNDKKEIIHSILKELEGNDLHSIGKANEAAVNNKNPF